MGILQSNKEDKDYEEAEVVYVSGSNFSIEKIGKRLRVHIEDLLISQTGPVSKGTEIDVEGVDGGFEIIYLHPDKAVVTKDTEFIFHDKVYYRPGWDEFDVEKGRLIEIEEKFGAIESQDHQKLATPESFANLLNKDNGTVKHYVNQDVWAVGKFYYQMKD